MFIYRSVCTDDIFGITLTEQIKNIHHVIIQHPQLFRLLQNVYMNDIVNIYIYRFVNYLDYCSFHIVVLLVW